MYISGLVLLLLSKISGNIKCLIVADCTADFKDVMQSKIYQALIIDDFSLFPSHNTFVLLILPIKNNT